MTRQNGKSGHAESDSLHPADNYAIYPHRDHVTSDSIPFNLDGYGDRGALNEEQILALCDRHGLSMAQGRDLSRLIGYSLDTDSEVSLVTVSRAIAERRFNDRSLAKRNRDPLLDASEANALFYSLGMKVVVSDDPGQIRSDPGSNARKKRTDDMASISLDEARRILQPDDRRKERDNRRLLVVESCCYVALDAGWSVTYTTDSTAEKNQRGGRLIDLIKDVIALVSHNARIASVHTIKSDIELVRRRFTLRGDLPPPSPRK